MEQRIAASIASQYRQTHERVLELVARLPPEDLAWRPQDGEHAAAWILWHLARWADHLQAALPGMTPELADRLGPREQVWTREALAAAWGMDGSTLGFEQTGSHMDATAASRFEGPAAELLVGYARQAFAAAEEAVALLTEADLCRPNAGQEEFDAAYHGSVPPAALDRPRETVADAVLDHIVHDNRHLGELEALIGLRRGNGSATD